jgi:hypothetical protein
MEMSDKLQAPATLTLEKAPLYPLYKNFGGPKSRSQLYGVEKIIIPLTRIEPQPYSP